MKITFKLLFIAGMACSSNAFGMQDILKRRAGIATPPSEEASMESSYVVTPRAAQTVLTDEALEKLTDIQNRQDNVPAKIKPPKKLILAHEGSFLESIKKASIKDLAKASETPAKEKKEEEGLPVFFREMSIRASQFKNQSNSNNSDEDDIDEIAPANNNATDYDYDATPPAYTNPDLQARLATPGTPAPAPDLPPFVLPARDDHLIHQNARIPSVYTCPGLQARTGHPEATRRTPGTPVPAPDEAPIIEEIADQEAVAREAKLVAERNRRRARMTDEQRVDTDLAQQAMPPREQRPAPGTRPNNPPRPHNVGPNASADQRNRPNAPIANGNRNPLPPALKNLQIPVIRPAKTISKPNALPKTSVDAKAMPGKQPPQFNPANLIISAGLFGILTWLNESIIKEKALTNNKYAIAQEVTTGAQQSAAANFAQQLLPGKSANTAAFTAAFAMLHACEVGLKKVTNKLLSKTVRGKKISAALAKMPARKRKILEHTTTAASWLIKTLVARAVTA